MKFSLPFLLATVLAATTNAYEMHVYFQDGLEIRVTGDQATPCQDFPPVVRGNKVNRITFDKGPYTSNFNIWSEINCGGPLVKNGHDGAHEIDPPAGVGSFKVM